MRKLIRAWHILVEIGMWYNGYAQLNLANAIILNDIKLKLNKKVA